MSTGSPNPLQRAELLRRAFDDSFAAPPPDVESAYHDLLALNIGGDPYAVRLSHVGALFVGKHVMWLPGSVAQLLGVAAVRGAVLAVYDLASLLGYPRAVAPRWCLRAAGSAVALAFERFDGHRRVGPAAISTSRRPETHVPHVREVVSVDELVCPVIDMPSVVDAIARLTSVPERRSID